MGKSLHALPHLIEIVVEVLRLNWPHPVIGHSLVALPQHRQSAFVMMCRAFGLFLCKYKADASQLITALCEAISLE